MVSPGCGPGLVASRACTTGQAKAGAPPGLAEAIDYTMGSRLVPGMHFEPLVTTLRKPRRGARFRLPGVQARDATNPGPKAGRLNVSSET